MPCPPYLVNYLVVQVSDSANFSSPTETVIAARTNTLTVAGVAGGTKYVRTKWRRTSAVVGPPAIPAEESAWSNTLTLVFPKITADDIDSVPVPECQDAPPVPKIQSARGWSEFIEIDLLRGGVGTEGCLVWFDGSLTGAQGFKGGMYVKNLSTDPTIKIEQVDYFMGNNPPHCAGFTSLYSDPLDANPYVRPYTSLPTRTNITTIDPGDPGGPVREGVDYVASLTGSVAPKWVEYIKIPAFPGSTTMVCPQDSTEGESIDLAYHCMDAYFSCRLVLTDFSAELRGVAQPSLGVCCYARGASPFISALGRTAFPPFIQHVPFAGTYGSFSGNSAPPYGRFRVRFSTGLVIDSEGKVGTEMITGGMFSLLLQPTTENLRQMDDFFLFMSETPFSATLDAGSGLWQDALGELPEGVVLVKIARSTSLLATNYLGLSLDPAKTYYFRVGARRFENFCQMDPFYSYSETLSAQVSQRVGANVTDEGGEDPGTPLAPIEAPVPGAAFQLAAGPGMQLIVDEEARTIEIGIDQAAIKESSGFLWVKSGNATTGTNLVAQYTADFDGTFKDWSIKAVTAPTTQSVILDVNKNGTSIFANGGNRPTLPAGQTSATGNVINTPNFVKGDVFTFDIDQVGTGVPGERVQLQLNFDSPLRFL